MRHAPEALEVRRPNLSESVRVAPLTVETWEALAGLFGEGGDPRWCWCQYWRLRSTEFAALKVPELRARLAAEAASPEPPGLVALEPDPVDQAGERAVGWVGLGPRGSFDRIVRSRVIPRVDDRPVWSIVCFSVSRSARGRGVGTALLDAAVAHARGCGAVAVEAYPVVVEPGDRVAAGSAFPGTLSMFERAGFVVVADRASDPSSRYRRVVVRREL